MSIEWVAGQLRAGGDDDLAREAVKLLVRYQGRHGETADIPFPVGEHQLYPQPSEQPATLEDAIVKYKEAWDDMENNALTPELVDQTWQLFWNTKAKEIGLDHELEIPRCDRSKEELVALRKQKRGVILLPDEIMTAEGQLILLKMFPNIVSKRSRVTLERFRNKYTEGGCIDVEMESMPPNKDNPAYGVGLNTRIKASGRQGQRVQTYIVASQFYHLMTGQYFDERESSSLPGTSLSSGIVWARRKSDLGEIVFGQGHYVANGYRTEGRKSIKSSK
jgi:hypothetical protein